MLESAHAGRVRVDTLRWAEVGRVGKEKEEEKRQVGAKRLMLRGLEEIIVMVAMETFALLGEPVVVSTQFSRHFPDHFCGLSCELRREAFVIELLIAHPRGKRRQTVDAPFCSIDGLISATLRLCTVIVRTGAQGDGSCGACAGDGSSTTGEPFSLPSCPYGPRWLFMAEPTSSVSSGGKKLWRGDSTASGLGEEYCCSRSADFEGCSSASWRPLSSLNRWL